MVAIVCLLQTECGPARDDLDLVIDVSDKCIAQVDCAGNTLDQRHHVDWEAGLQLGQLEQVVHDNV